VIAVEACSLVLRIIAVMHRLRTARTLAWAVLAWMAMTVCAATLAPLASSVQRADALERQGAPACDPTALTSPAPELPAHHSSAGGMHCPLCLPAAPPNQLLPDDFTSTSPAQRVALPAARVHLRHLAAAPLPPRGPPPLS
jgi:hypothetical protein